MEITKLIVGMVQTNCYIVLNKEKKEAIVVDPGDDAAAIRNACQNLEVEVKAILLTHGHFDHIMAVEELRREWNVPVYACEKEKEVLSDDSLNLSDRFMGNEIHLKADVWLKDQELFELMGYRFQMIETPGHTEGSCCYYVESEKVLFSGDTLFEGSYGRVDFPTSSSRDMVHSVAQVLFDLPDDVKVYPGHMGATTIGEEKRYNPLAGYRGKGI